MATLDQFRAILDHLDPEERPHQLLFFRALHDVGSEAIPELAPRMQRVGTSRAFRQLVLEGSYYHPWPGWVPLLERALRREADPELFSVGVAALGNIGTEEALVSLKALSRLALGPGLPERVAEALAQADPSQAWDHHLHLLLQGSENTSVANEAARQLGLLLAPDRLESLKPLVAHPDLLVFRQAIRLVARIQSPEAAAFLAAYLEECHREVLEDRALKDLMAGLRSLERDTFREQALAALSEPFAAAQAPALEALRTQSGSLGVATAERLRDQATRATDRFLLDLVAAHLEPKSLRWSGLFTEAVEAMNQRARRQAFAMEAGAEGLAAMARAGLQAPGEAVRILEESLLHQTGREGVARALASLTGAEDTARLEQLIHHPDNGSRAAVVETLGERQEEALRPILLAACRDPISDIAQRAMLHLGKLPGLDALTRDLLKANHLDDIKLGIRLVGLHRQTGLAPELLELVQNASREELALEALEALGHACDPERGQALAGLLHSGQSPRMQLALAQALRDLAHPELAESLCSRADELRNPLLHAMALEALAEAGVDDPARVRAQVAGAWEGRNPWATRLRVILGLPALASEDRKLWGELATLTQNGLAEAKSGSGWSAGELAKVQAVARELARRASGQ